MKIQIWSCCLFLGLCGELSAVTFTKLVGEDLIFRCKVGRTGYEGYVKYLCNRACKWDDVLVMTKQPNTIITNGKYTIDDGEKERFSVRIKRLEKTDSGSYWCAVERFGYDLYDDFYLNVLDVPAPPNPPVTSKPTVLPAPSILSTQTSERTHLSTTSSNTFMLQTSGNYRLSASSSSSLPDTSGQSLPVFALYAGFGIFVLIISMMALTLQLCRKMTKSPSASTNIVIADSTPTDAVYEDVAVEGEQRDIPVNTFNHAPAFNTQYDNIHISDVYANNSCPENAMDPVCSKLDLAEDPGVHVTQDNPIYSSAKEDYETTEHTKYSTDVYSVLMKPKQKM